MDITKARTDTTDLLSIWGETLTTKRRSTSYDEMGKATVTWETVGAFIGDWQPITGSVVIEEQGLEIQSDSQIIAAHDVDVQAGDRIYKADGTFEYVNYVHNYEDHVTIRMILTEGE